MTTYYKNDESEVNFNRHLARAETESNARTACVAATAVLPEPLRRHSSVLCTGTIDGAQVRKSDCLIGHCMQESMRQCKLEILIRG